MPLMRRSPLLRILRLALPFWRGMTLAALLGALTIASSVSLMATSAWLISKAALQPSIAELSVAVVSVRFFGIARGVFRYLERLVSHETTFRLLAHLRVQFYRALEPLAPARLISLSSGDLLSRVVGDIESLQNLYLRAVAPPFVAALMALFLTLLLNYFDPHIALMALAFILAAAVLVPLLAWWGSAVSGHTRVIASAALHTALIDSTQGMAEVLLYGQASAQVDRINDLGGQLVAAEQRMIRFDALQLAMTAFLTSAAALAVLTVAIPRIDGLYLATVALATAAVFEAFTPLAQAAVHLGTNAQAAGRLFEVADMPPAVTDPPVPASPPNDSRLEIRSLSFSYTPGSRAILSDLSLSIEPRQHVAILGDSGSGKSTLTNVLLRFWDYQQGSILLGGRELRTLSLFDVRAAFGVMSQRTTLFNTTIRENILIARPDATYADLERAAHLAQIDDFILSLPEGYDTLVGEEGTLLSGGERQRIALARVLLRNSLILILDEATANLDPVTERAVMNTVLTAATGRSMLVFTHRHTLLDRMDHVYFLRDGRLQ